MALLARAHEVPEAQAPMRTAGGGLFTKQVFGLKSSMMVARRSAGYHSAPHVHDCEQLNYLAEGRITILVEGKAYELAPGDFLRVPAGAVHWAENSSDGDALLFEVHAPGLDLLPPDSVVELLGPGEQPGQIEKVPNVWVEGGAST